MTKKEEMRFILKADCIFWATDIDDAFHKLGVHFIELYADNEQDDELFERGDVIVKPYSSDNESKDR